MIYISAFFIGLIVGVMYEYATQPLWMRTLKRQK
jgi:hypothetical protein